jgi:glycyl-tRNA synthetase beta chain
MGKELLFEIGTEEIPSGYLPGALEELRSAAERMLAAERLRFADLRTLGTPRRLTLFVDGLEARQADARREVTGPPKSAAFDAAGAPTRAAEGFARAQGVSVERLEVRRLDRGEYVVAVVEEKGSGTPEVLTALLPRLVAALSFPKFMRWGEGAFRFVRPIRWLLAIYGGRTVPVTVETVRADGKTCGHRFLAPRPVRVRGFQDYLATLEERYVIAEPARRRAMVREAATAAAAAVQGQPLLDPALVEAVADLVEFPVAVCGSFDPEYLDLPREVIVTPMQKHQRYFPVADAAGNLLPHFVAIANMRVKDMAVMRQGYERVLKARLSDAAFFFREDRKQPLEDRLADLKRVVFQERLGSVADKAERLRSLAASLAAQADPGLAAVVDRSALLAKADLVTGMVKEFPELQGVMGRVYARLSGEPPAVCQAIEEHYLPRFAGDRLPESAAGALVGIADRLDSMAGCFRIGLIPSGSEDPYGLRRAAQGVVQILLHHQLRLRLDTAVAAALAGFDALGGDAASLAAEMLDFLRARTQAVLLERGLPAEVIDAALSAGAVDVVNAAQRAEALAVFRQDPDFGELCTAFRRVVGIVPKGFDRPVDPARLVEAAERTLYAQLAEIKGAADRLVAAQDYAGALREIAELKPVVDMFFEEVLVIGPDEALTSNRFALLKAVGSLFSGLADFTKITG